MSLEPVLTGTVGALLFRLGHEGLQGALCVETLGGTARLVVRGDQLYAIEGVPDLLSALSGRVPDSKALTGSLTHDIPVCMALGIGLDEIFDAAGARVGALLASHDGQPADFEEGARPPKGAFPLPVGLMRLYSEAVTGADPDAIARRYQKRQGETLRVMVHPDDAKGLGPVVLRTLRAAWRSGNLEELLAHARTPARLRETWTSLDLLVRMGIVLVGDQAAPRDSGRRKEPPKAPEPPPPPPPAPPPPKKPSRELGFALTDDDTEERGALGADEETDDDPSALAALDEGGAEVFALGHDEDEDAGDDLGFDAYDEDSEDDDSEDEPSALASLDDGGNEVFALGHDEEHEDSEDSEYEDDEDSEDSEYEDDEDSEDEDSEKELLDLGQQGALSSLESDQESDDVFAMDAWDEDDDEYEDDEDSEDDDDEDDDDDESPVAVIDDEDEGEPHALSAFLDHPDPAVSAMARFYSELMRAGPLAPLGLKGEDLDGYLTVERMRMRANRALGRWHPALHSHRAPEAQQAVMELYKLVQSRLEAMGSLDSLASALEVLRRARGWPRSSKEDRAKAAAMYRRATALAKGRAWEAVVVMAEKATVLAPGEVRYHALDLLARTVLEELSPESAVVNLDALPARRQGDAILKHDVAGRIWDQAGRSKRALERYEMVLELSPEHAHAGHRVEQLRATGVGPEDTDAGLVGLLAGLFRRG